MKLEIKSTETSPEVVFDMEAGKFSIKGDSFMKDSHLFYAPIIRFIEDYCEKPLTHTELSFDLDYLQTSSQKFLLTIIRKFSQLKDEPGHELLVNWYYIDETDHEDILITGKEIQDVYNLNFNFIKKEGH